MDQQIESKCPGPVEMAASVELAIVTMILMLIIMSTTVSSSSASH